MANPAPPPNMPSRNHRTAPAFNPYEPRTLFRYFEDLGTLFTQCGVADAAEQKRYACTYIPVNEEDVWTAIPQYSNVASTFDEFKEAIFELYPSCSKDRRYTIDDLDRLTGAQQRLGIQSLEELSTYYRQFYAISSFLISKNRLSKGEQSRSFRRGLSDALWARISARLQLKFPDHSPDDFYPLNDIIAAGKFVLHGTTAPPPREPAPYIIAQPPQPAQPQVKAEDFGAIFDNFAKSITQALAPAISALQNQAQQNTRPPPGKCHYCGEAGHMIGACPIVDEDIRTGRCRRGGDGRVILPGGTYVPGAIQGTTMRDRIMEWHRLHPGQLGAATADHMMFEIASSPAPPANFYALSTEDRISALQAELNALREIKAQRARRVFDGVEIPTRPRYKEKAREVAPSQPPQPPRPENPPQPAQAAPVQPDRQQPPVASASSLHPRYPQHAQPQLGPAPSPSIAQPQQPVAPIVEAAPAPPKQAEHPFADARDANYLPPRDRNVGALPPKQSKDKEAAYRTTAPIQDPKFAEEVFNRSMKTPFVTLSSEELYSISHEIRAKVRDAVTPRRNPVIAPVATMAYITEVPDEDDPDYDRELPPHLYTNVKKLREEEARAQANTDPPSSTICEPSSSTAPSSVSSVQDSPSSSSSQLAQLAWLPFSIPDPIEMYISSLEPGEEAQKIVVAKESHSLRSIYALVDNKEQIECVIDPGSQVISMSEEVCHALGISYDPTFKISLQSANSTLDYSLGLARHVPFQIAEITVYLQVHVIRDTAYDILLGRPFDVLTSSCVKNYSNEDQTITIVCPNTRQQATVPTLPRGKPRFQVPPAPRYISQGFRNSKP